MFAVYFFSATTLFGLPLEAAVYPLALSLGTGVVFFAVGYARYRVKLRALGTLDTPEARSLAQLPPERGLLETEYQRLIDALRNDNEQLRARFEGERRDLADYYSTWAHQINTPIAASRLLLGSDASERGAALSAELDKVAQYVEMALNYTRLDGDPNDIQLRRQPIDPIVKAAIRRCARLFILKRIALSFEPTDIEAVTDEKWLGFAVEQLLTNAAKYTPEGGHARLYKRGAALVIEDDGVGMRVEDLPRVFEKGFSGYNGRAGRKSTGVGLYLTRRALTLCGHEARLESEPGRGTRAIISFNLAKM